MQGMGSALGAGATRERDTQHHRRRKTWKASFAILCAGLLPVFFWPVASVAAVLPETLYAELEQRFDAHVGVAGFSTVDPEKLTGEGWYDASRFPGHSATAMFHPDADLHPVTRAILLLESREPALPHTRYRVSYRLEAADADHAEVQHAYIEVIRFNLGPARHADVVESYGEHAAPIEEFGVGPSVAWRFVMESVMGMRADVVRASRKTLAPKEIDTADCLGSRCTALPDPSGPAGKQWKEFSPNLGKRRVAYADRQDAIPNAARMADDLIVEATADGEDSTLAGSTEPTMVAVISLNADGQDDVAIGTLLQDHLLDDSIAQLWTREIATGESQDASWSRTSVGRSESATRAAQP